MRRRFKRKFKKEEKVPQMRANDRIFADPIYLIDQEGENVGEISLKEAKILAESVGLDLVEVSPKAEPPVCKILDFGKFQYNQTKQFKQNKSQQKKVDTKVVKIGLRTGDHDLDFKKTQIEKFLTKGHKVKIEMVLRGREKAHGDLGRQNMDDFIKTISIPFKFEEEVKKSPDGCFNTLIVPG
jgi:translation initiation factor IF-3